MESMGGDESREKERYMYRKNTMATSIGKNSDGGFSTK